MSKVRFSGDPELLHAYYSISSLWLEPSRAERSELIGDRKFPELGYKEGWRGVLHPFEMSQPNDLSPEQIHAQIATLQAQQAITEQRTEVE